MGQLGDEGRAGHEVYPHAYPQPKRAQNSMEFDGHKETAFFQRLVSLNGPHWHSVEMNWRSGRDSNPGWA